MSYNNDQFSGSVSPAGFRTGIDQFDTSKLELGMSYVLARSFAPASVTGTLAETDLATIDIPAGLMGPNGVLRIVCFWSFTNSANTKTVRNRFGASPLSSLQVTAIGSSRTTSYAFNRNAENSQLGSTATQGISDGSSAGAWTNLAVDTTVAQTIRITAQLANAGESVTLEGYMVEVMPSA